MQIILQAGQYLKGAALNGYAVVILSALLLDWILDILTGALNLKNLSPRLPAEFRGFYDAKTYRRSRQYTRTSTRFEWISNSFDLIVTLMFWFLGGFNSLDTLVRSWGLHPVATGLLYIGFLMFMRSVLSLPFGIYATFVIEERFGFNKTTPSVYAKDMVKAIVLAIVLGSPLLAGVLAFFQYAGPWAWVAAWAGATLFSLFVQFIAPVWIMPLFNKFTPLPKGNLRTSIVRFARSVRYPLAGIFVIDGSRRSTKSNAFLTGFGKHKRIALYDTLIQKHSVPELVAVLAHEMGHYKKKHIRNGMIIAILHTGLVLFLFSWFLGRQGLFEAFHMENSSVYAGLLFFGMLYSPMEMLLSLGMNTLSRRNEFQADAFAVQTTHKPEAFIKALKKLTAHNLSNLRPHPLTVFLHHSHPPIMKRIEAIRSFQKRSG